jgi:hypothetical protein
MFFLRNDFACPLCAQSLRTLLHSPNCQLFSFQGLCTLRQKHFGSGVLPAMSAMAFASVPRNEAQLANNQSRITSLPWCLAESPISSLESTETMADHVSVFLTKTLELATKNSANREVEQLGIGKHS